MVCDMGEVVAVGVVCDLPSGEETMLNWFGSILSSREVSMVGFFVPFSLVTDFWTRCEAPEILV